MARLRSGPAPASALDGEALASLIADGLAERAGDRAQLPQR
jgi:hypothetical protein